MISLRVEFLGGAYHAADHTLRSPEWPPHPDRVYQALTATLHELGNQPQQRAALLAIEGAPWCITASRAINRPAMVQYVPRNEDSGAGKNSYNPVLATSRAKERHLPVCQPDQSVVYFHIDTHTESAALDRLARSVARLGRSHVILTVAAADDSPAPTWEPVTTGDSGAELLVRVPYTGRLQDLEAAFQAGQRARIEWRRYRRCHPVDTPVFRTGEFGEFFALAASGRGVDTSRIAPLVEVARRAVLSTCSDPLPAWLSGHEADGERLRGPHLGIVPLAFCGKHGDGRIMGLGLACPKHVDPVEVRDVLQPVLADGLQLAHQVWSVRNCRSVTTEVTSWIGPATAWTTATPMEIRRRDRRSPLEIATEWAQRAALPPPEAARLRAEPFVDGPFHAAQYAPGKRPRFRVHALVQWNEPIQGPVVLGMGRYRGFGAMRPA